MASNSSYPSPGDHDMSTSSGPFYTGELDLAAKLSRAAAPLMVSTSAEDQQTHHALVTASHVLSPARPVGSPQQLAQDVMSLQSDSYEQSSRRHDILIPDNNGHVRKRSKVSRACDECRRKKTRCNATPESTEACVGCKRSGAQCLFSRQPLKRGPSKGYIRHLSERLATLERTLGSHSEALSQATLSQPSLSPNSSLASLNQSPGMLNEYPTSQILYDRMERLEGRIEEMLSQLSHHATKHHDPSSQLGLAENSVENSVANSMDNSMNNSMDHSMNNPMDNSMDNSIENPLDGSMTHSMETTMDNSLPMESSLQMDLSSPNCTADGMGSIAADSGPPPAEAMTGAVEAGNNEKSLSMEMLS